MRLPVAWRCGESASWQVRVDCQLLLDRRVEVSKALHHVAQRRDELGGAFPVEGARVRIQVDLRRDTSDSGRH